MRLEVLVETHGLSAFLLDAAGVLYNEGGGIATGPGAVAYLQSRGPVFLATNNSCHNPKVISHYLETLGYSISPECIFSSGYGLSEDPELSSLISGKKIFWIGQDDALFYIERLPRCELVSRIEDAEVVVLASSIGIESSDYYMTLGKYLRENPRPVVCCNPDRYIRGFGQTTIPVTGYYAAHFESLGVKVHWVGKPLLNYSKMIQQKLRAQGIETSKQVCFFDDNPKNVMAMMDHIGIAGCWIKTSGIGFLFDPSEIVTDFGLDQLS